MFRCLINRRKIKSMKFWRGGAQILEKLVAEMVPNNLEKMASINGHMRFLVPGKVFEDNKLIEYDALLLDRFLDIL